MDSGTAAISADPARDGAFTLELNQVPSSYFVLGAPRVLGFDYMEWIAALLRAHFSTDSPPPVFLHLGGAGCSLARYCADVWKGSRQVVVDVDPALLELARERCDVPPDIEFVVGDARAELRQADAIIRDVFAGPTVPRHVTTKEFFTRAASLGGLYIANIGDRQELPESRAELAGMLEAFPCVGAVSTREMLGGRSYGNIVVYGAEHPLDIDRLGLPDSAEHRGTEWVRQCVGNTPPRHD